jgi:hypothetical protein
VTVIVVGISNFVAGNLYWLLPLLLVAGALFGWWSRTPSVS